ncbi:MAG: hypothetical protein ACJAXI_003498 [Crocinitomicaceae bacterium]|jgi:hypothetical protein
MIYEIIKILSIQVSNHTGITVDLDNIANADLGGVGGAGGGAGGAATMITLVNYDEEGSMRNIPNHRISGNKVFQQQPTVSLNLFLLFSSTKVTLKA